VQAAHVATGLFTGGFSSAPALYGINYGFQGLDAIVDRTLIGSHEKYEQEADQLGVQYAWKAGFDPKGIVVLLDSISQKEYSKTAGFFRTHPQVDERMLDIFSEIQFLPESAAGTRDSLEFHQIKERIGK
jgi:predicted Zn-dependent protease